MKINENFVRRLERKVESTEATMRWMLKVQRTSLAQAERLRVLAMALAASRWQHRCSDKVGGCCAVSESKLTELREHLKKLTRFYKPLPKRDEVKVQAFLKGGKRGKVGR